MLKRLFITTILSIQCLTMAHADSATQKPKGNWNRVIIYNKTGHDLVYTFMGVYGGAVYAIKKDDYDIYHSGMGDEYARIQVGNCNQMNNQQNTCSSFSALTYCTGSRHYNADLIKTVIINSNDSCTITCTDGSNTSCLQSG